MNAIFSALFTVLSPIAIIVFPAAVCLRRGRGFFTAAAESLFISLSGAILGTFILTLLHLPVWWYVPLLLLSLLPCVILQIRRQTGARPSVRLAFVFLFLVITGLLSAPFFRWQEALPAGDSQKAIYWASRVLSSNSLPPYADSTVLFNRDPVDFYTPALHTLTALVMRLSPAPLTGVGIFSLVLCTSLLFAGFALAARLFSRHIFSAAALTVFFVLINVRFWRYAAEPGYHLQNLLGELLLLGALLCILKLVAAWHWRTVVLGSMLLASLAFSHQFSAFVAAFILLPPMIIAIVRRWRASRPSLYWLFLPLSLIAGVSITAAALSLYQKLPHFFTLTPHLLFETPSLYAYPSLMGSLWIGLASAGLALLSLDALRSSSNRSVKLSFALSLIVIIALSQGPRLGLDIPPVRALFYALVPGSLAATYAVIRITGAIKKRFHPRTARWLPAVAVSSTLVAGIVSVLPALHPSHAVRTDSSLSSGLSFLISSAAAGDTNGILTDDYNHRAASWLILSGRPVFSRLSSDISLLMLENTQSALRRELYLKNLAWEKIYSLGSRPEAVELMRENNLSAVTGVSGTSESAFAHNSGLLRGRSADNVVMFTPASSDAAPRDTFSAWLKKPATLANDIGDDEDVFLHLPAAISSPRLSKPLWDGSRTYRISAAPHIPLVFNAGAYVQTLWHQTPGSLNDSSLDLLVLLAQPDASLSLTTASGSSFPLMQSINYIRLPARTVLLDAKGFITLTIDNPASHPVGIDLIALGPSSIP